MLEIVKVSRSTRVEPKLEGIITMTRLVNTVVTCAAQYVELRAVKLVLTI